MMSPITIGDNISISRMRSSSRERCGIPHRIPEVVLDIRPQFGMGERFEWVIDPNSGRKCIVAICKPPLKTHHAENFSHAPTPLPFSTDGNGFEIPVPERTARLGNLKLEQLRRKDCKVGFFLIQSGRFFVLSHCVRRYVRLPHEK